jgi:hypothetical protein
MNAKHIILTHFSARYPKVPALPSYLDENGVCVAMDNLVVSMETLPKVSKLNEIYRIIYEEELFNIESRNFIKGVKGAKEPSMPEPPAKKRAVDCDTL